MAEKGRGPLADGVERFDRLVRIVKDSQLGRTVLRPSAGETFVLSPEDAWAKKYMTRCIGPVCYTVETEPPVFAKFALRPEPAAPGQVLRAPARTAPLPHREAADEPIGLLIGKPVRRRSWLGRLFGR
jgi:hypothetical protein